MPGSEASWLDDKEVTSSPTGTSPAPQHEPSWTDNVVPPTHRNRTLIVCFDGTGDKFDADNSNIVQFISMLKKDNRREQMVYYQAGIGTYTSGHAPGFINAINRKISKIMDQAVAWSLPLHTQAGYEFLMQNYQYGDKICIFGFSRGAYTARALAGMLTKVGLLPADNKEQIPFAYKMYARDDEFGWEQSCAFRSAFSIKVQVDFLGVWDTVNSVGLFPKRLPFTMENSGVRAYRHAVSLDEHRAKFTANLSPHSGGAEEGHQIEKRRREKRKKRPTLRELEKRWSDPCASTDVLEVWFSGCHCDVGGGAVKNDTRNALARIPLRWMIRQCFLVETGIMFNARLLASIGLDPDALYPNVLPRPDPITFQDVDHSRIASDRVSGRVATVDRRMVLSEEEEDLADALSPVNDELSLSRSWWALELLPMTHKHQKKDGSWVWRTKANLGKGRRIPRGDNYKIRVHRTVRIRMEAEDGILPERRRYVPRAAPWEHHRLEWVD